MHNQDNAEISFNEVLDIHCEELDARLEMEVSLPDLIVEAVKTTVTIEF